MEVFRVMAANVTNAQGLYRSSSMCAVFVQTSKPEAMFRLN